MRALITVVWPTTTNGAVAVKGEERSRKLGCFNDCYTLVDLILKQANLDDLGLLGVVAGQHSYEVASGVHVSWQIHHPVPCLVHES